MEAVKCPVCGGQVYRNRQGQILAHTQPGAEYSTFRGRVLDVKVCPGATKGARP